MKDTCELCGRQGVVLTRHHLVPRTRHRNKRVRRRFSRQELATRILMVCRPCHSQIHALLSEKALAEQFHSREALLAHPGIRRFVEWIRTRPADLKPRGRKRRR